MNGKLYKTMVRPMMLYGTEHLTLNRKEENKMEVAKMTK